MSDGVASMPCQLITGTSCRGPVVIVTAGAIVVLPALSVTTAETEWLPTGSVDVSKVVE
jgi:hypothetical protein